LQIAGCRLPIHGVAIEEWRLDCRLVIRSAIPAIVNPNRTLVIPITIAVNRHSVNLPSALANLQ